MQVGFAFGRIESALTVLVANLSELSSLAAKTERIDALFSGAPDCQEAHRRRAVLVLSAQIRAPACRRQYDLKSDETARPPTVCASCSSAGLAARQRQPHRASAVSRWRWALSFPSNGGTLPRFLVVVTCQNVVNMHSVAMSDIERLLAMRRSASEESLVCAARDSLRRPSGNSWRMCRSASGRPDAVASGGRQAACACHSSLLLPEINTPMLSELCRSAFGRPHAGAPRRRQGADCFSACEHRARAVAAGRRAVGLRQIQPPARGRR